MIDQFEIDSTATENTKRINDFILQSGVDLYGIANLRNYKERSESLRSVQDLILNRYHFGIVLGIPQNHAGKRLNDMEASLILEEAAFGVMVYLNDVEKHSALIIHTDDEIEPFERLGLLSLKSLARAAGLGWQGRSSLIISPEYGPLYRIIAILTDLQLVENDLILNQCGKCSLCVVKCPTNALILSKNTNYYENREDVLDIDKCKGGEGCKICIDVCPW
ncbi:MAG: 4Fe-4S dicluster domain-containing protein [Mariniphaga sp.]